MKDFATDITQRFLLVKQEVIREGLCSTAKEFGAAIGEHSQNFAKMENGTRSPTLDQIARVCDQYGYNGNWILMGMAPKKLDKKQEVPFEQRLATLEMDVRRIKKQMEK